MRRAVGAVYQTVTRWSCSVPVPALGVEVGLVDDGGHAVGERGDDPVGGPGHPARVGRAPEDVVGVQVERRPTRWRGGRPPRSWTWTAPLGVPVVPLVKCSRAMSSGSVGGISNSVDRPRRPGGGTRGCRRCPSPSTSSDVLEGGEPAQDRRRPCGGRSAGVVTRTRPSPRLRRWCTGSGPNAENSGLSTLRFFRVPSAVTYSSGIRPRRVNTRSPVPTPRALERVGELVGPGGQVGVGRLREAAVTVEPAKGDPVASLGVRRRGGRPPRGRC